MILEQKKPILSWQNITSILSIILVSIVLLLYFSLCLVIPYLGFNSATTLRMFSNNKFIKPEYNNEPNIVYIASVDKSIVSPFFLNIYDEETFSLNIAAQKMKLNKPSFFIHMQKYNKTVNQINKIKIDKESLGLSFLTRKLLYRFYYNKDSLDDQLNKKTRSYNRDRRLIPTKLTDPDFFYPVKQTGFFTSRSALQVTLTSALSICNGKGNDPEFNLNIYLPKKPIGIDGFYDILYKDKIFNYEGDWLVSDEGMIDSDKEYFKYSLNYPAHAELLKTLNLIRNTNGSVVCPSRFEFGINRATKVVGDPRVCQH